MIQFTFELVILAAVWSEIGVVGGKTGDQKKTKTKKPQERFIMVLVTGG